MEARELESSDTQNVVESLATGFFDSPFMSWIYTDETTRLDALRAWFACWTDVYADKGLSYTVDDAQGAALWAVPHGDYLDDEGQAALFEVIQRWNGERTGFVIEALMPLSKHPPQPYWYLNAIAVRPDGRGKGIGAKLIEPMLDRADHEGVPVYLESSNPRNLSFYFRYGFQCWGERLVMPEGGPPIQPLLRRANAGAGSGE